MSAKHKNRGSRRDMREKHIRRKERIVQAHWTDSRPHEIDARDIVEISMFRDGYKSGFGWWLNMVGYDHRGSLAKGKIHCSCPLCRDKTKNKGKHRSPYSPTVNYKASDRRRVDSLADSMKDYYEYLSAAAKPVLWEEPDA